MMIHSMKRGYVPICVHTFELQYVLHTHTVYELQDKRKFLEIKINDYIHQLINSNVSSSKFVFFTVMLVCQSVGRNMQL